MSSPGDCFILVRQRAYVPRLFGEQRPIPPFRPHRLHNLAQRLHSPSRTTTMHALLCQCKVSTFMARYYLRSGYFRGRFVKANKQRCTGSANKLRLMEKKKAKNIRGNTLPLWFAVICFFCRINAGFAATSCCSRLGVLFSPL